MSRRHLVLRWAAIVLLAVTATLLTRSCRADAAPPSHARGAVTGAGAPAGTCGTPPAGTSAARQEAPWS
jgi:hypothetical protein